MNTGILSVWIFICIFYFQIQGKTLLFEINEIYGLPVQSCPVLKMMTTSYATFHVLLSNLIFSKYSQCVCNNIPPFMQRTLIVFYFSDIIFLQCHFIFSESRCAVKTTSGELCVFPFYYNKKLYYSCTTVDYENKLWCATSFNYNRDNKWGDCDTTRGKWKHPSYRRPTILCQALAYLWNIKGINELYVENDIMTDVTSGHAFRN
jgi:hypothetical protein